MRRRKPSWRLWTLVLSCLLWLQRFLRQWLAIPDLLTGQTAPANRRLGIDAHRRIHRQAKATERLTLLDDFFDDLAVADLAGKRGDGDVSHDLVEERFGADLTLTLDAARDERGFAFLDHLTVAAQIERRTLERRQKLDHGWNDATTLAPKSPRL